MGYGGLDRRLSAAKSAKLNNGVTIIATAAAIKSRLIVHMAQFPLAQFLYAQHNICICALPSKVARVAGPFN
jgi:hypothetical protein